MKIERDMKYKVTYTSGGGAEYEDGIWEVKRTPKRILVTCLEEGFFGNHETGEKIRIGKGTGNPIKNEDDDGSFICYFSQAGTPYYFEPIF